MSKFENGLFVIDFIWSKLKILFILIEKIKFIVLSKIKYSNVVLLLYSSVILKCCQQQFNITELYTCN